MFGAFSNLRIARRPESLIAPYLTKLQDRLRPHNIQVGSYPVLYKGVFVSLIGRDLPSEASSSKAADRVWLADIATEVEREIGGRILSEEEVAEHKREVDSQAKKLKGSPGRVNEAVAEAKETSATGTVKAKF